MKLSRTARKILKNLVEGRLIQAGPGLRVHFDAAQGVLVVRAAPGITGLGNATVPREDLDAGTYGAYGESGWEVPGP